MREWHRPIRHLGLLTLALMNSISTSRGDTLYSATSLGPARPSAAFLNGTSQLDPSGNYLNALSPADQTAFRAGSFDVFAHPATGNDSVAATADLTSLSGSSPESVRGVGMVTGNNNGNYIGKAEVPDSLGLTDAVVEYSPDPHTIQFIRSIPYTWSEQGKSSPGDVFKVRLTPDIDALDVTPSGLNDHGYIIYNMPNYGPKGVLGWTPYIQGQNIPAAPTWGNMQLPGLGGSFGLANALNNSNQI